MDRVPTGFGNAPLRVAGIGGTLRKGSSSLGALRCALSAAEKAGAEVELLDLRELELPMYEPEKPLEKYAENVEQYIETVRRCDALVVSTGSYHGTLGGATKNALDFLQFLAADEWPYLGGKAVGLIATAGGEQAAANATAAMVHAVHALRGVVVPLSVPLPRVWEKVDEAGSITDKDYRGRLDSLGRLVVDLGLKLGPTHRSHVVGAAG